MIASIADIEVRAPRPDEWRACRALLPEAFSSGVLPQLLLAARAQPFGYLGACAAEPRSYEASPAWHLSLHVAPPFRRQGVGSHLIRTFVDRRAGPSVRTVIASHADDEPGAAAFLRSVGFAFSFRVSRYEVELAPYIERGQAFRARLVAHGKVPAGAAVARVSEVSREDVAQLLGSRTGPVADALGASWGDQLKRTSVREMSTALMLDGAIIGVVLADLEGTRGEMLWRAVAHDYRAGWANIVLSTASGERIFRAGGRTLRFTTTRETPDTERAVRLYGGEHVTHTDYFVRNL